MLIVLLKLRSVDELDFCVGNYVGLRVSEDTKKISKLLLLPKLFNGGHCEAVQNFPETITSN